MAWTDPSWLVPPLADRCVWRKAWVIVIRVRGWVFMNVLIHCGPMCGRTWVEVHGDDEDDEHGVEDDGVQIVA